MVPTHAASTGLRHQGVLYADTADLVARTAEALERDVRRGNAVTVIVDEPTRTRFHRALGAEVAAGLDFVDPAVAFADPAQTMVDRRRVAAVQQCAAGPITVLGQFQPWMQARDVAFWEAMFNVVLADLPVHLMCACPADVPAVAGVMRETHPELRTPSGVCANADYRGPEHVLAEHPPVAPPQPVDAPAARLTFTSLGDLPALRAAVTDHAALAGLTTDQVYAAAVAVSELAANSVEHGGGHGRVTLWVSGPGLVARVEDAGTPERRDQPGRGLSAARFGLAAPGAIAERGRGLWLTRALADTVHVWQDAAGSGVQAVVRRHPS